MRLSERLAASEYQDLL